MIIRSGILLALLGGSTFAGNCMPVRMQMWSEAISQMDAVCLVQCLSSSSANENGFRDVSVEVVEVLKTPAGAVRKGQRLNLRCSWDLEKKVPFLIVGKRTPNRLGIEWDEPYETTRVYFNYIAQAPPLDGNRQKRLRYFLQFVDSRDPFVKPDMAAELAQASDEELVAVIPSMPRDTFRKMLVDPTTPEDILYIPGLMLGLCGDAEDVKLLAAKITEKSHGADGFRLGIDAIMKGYLMLAGESALDNLDKWKLKDRAAPFSETYAAMVAIEFMWNKGDGKIRKDRLVQSMRLLLDRPEFPDLAIRDLSLWRDWNSIDRITGIYEQRNFFDRSTKRAIIRYLLSCIAAKPTDVRPDQVASAKRHLAEIRRNDPKFVAETERYFSPDN